MRTIEKKIWPEFFREVKSGQHRAGLRLADVRLRRGDVLLLREWDPKTRKYTGRVVRRKVRWLTRLNIFKFYPRSAIRKRGVYLIEYQ